MNGFIIFALLVFNIIYPVSILRAEMNLLNPETRLEKFKKEIHFNEILSKEASSPLVNSVNIDPTKYPQFNGWTLSSKITQNRGKEVSSEWVLKNNKESVLIHVYLSPKNIDASRKRFLETVDATSTMEISFEKGPDGIGTLSAIPSQRPYDYVLFIYKNTYVHVRSYQSEIDTLAICKLIYSQLLIT